MPTIKMPPSAIALTRPLDRGTCTVARQWATKRKQLVAKATVPTCSHGWAAPFRSCNGISERACRRGATKDQPFSLLPGQLQSRSLHARQAIGGRPVAGASRTKNGAPMDARQDIFGENDVALGRLIDWLEATPDPRRRPETHREHARHIHQRQWC